MKNNTEIAILSSYLALFYKGPQDKVLETADGIYSILPDQSLDVCG
jgi:hypothetical protein